VSHVKSADGVSIAYEVRGTKSPTLVFVHGWSCDRTYWAPQLEAFSKDHRVVAIDLGGHGDSGMGRKEWTIESFGEDVASVVKKLNLRDVILVGHSMGGDVIPDAALRLRGRVRGMIWIDTYKALGPGRKAEDVKTFVESFRPDFKNKTREIVQSMFLPTSDKKLVERIANDMSSAPESVALPAIESSFHNSRVITKRLDELKLPTIAINPDNSPTDMESMKRHNIEVVIMRGVGHFPQLEDPVRFNSVLADVIARLSKR